jgi:ribosomal-protein-alanine N-acetyltransferase
VSAALRTERLELVLLSPGLMEALLAGRRDEAGFAIPEDWPDEHSRRFLAYRVRQAHEDPAQEPWLVRAMVLDGEMIGHIGFHGAPGRNALQALDAVEVGYTVFPEHRGRGYATEAVRALFAWATEQGVHRFVASVGPQNEPSLAIVRKLGFREVGRHWDDEDGEELEFELLVDPPSG